MTDRSCSFPENEEAAAILSLVVAVRLGLACVGNMPHLSWICLPHGPMKSDCQPNVSESQQMNKVACVSLWQHTPTELQKDRQRGATKRENLLSVVYLVYNFQPSPCRPYISLNSPPESKLPLK